ncbi:MAG: PAS domain-containing protein [Thiobacillaceae bacterium]
MSSSLEKFKREREAAQRAVSEPEPRGGDRDAERPCTLIELEDSRKSMELAHQDCLTAVDTVPDPIFVHDKDFLVLSCNRAYQQRAGRPLEQIIGEPYYAVYPVAAAPLCNCTRVMEALDADSDEEEIRVGETVYCSRAVSINDRWGNYLCSEHLLEDITARKVAEERLMACHGLGFHEATGENVPSPGFLKDVGSPCLRCNNTAALHVERSDSENVTGKNEIQVRHRELAEPHRNPNSPIDDAQKPEGRIDGAATIAYLNIFQQRASKTLLRATYRQGLRLTAVHETITNSRQALQRLKLFRTLLDNCDDVSDVIDTLSLGLL